MQLADADLMILILGPSYGSIHSGTAISYTENEFRYPKKSGIEVLVFAVEKLGDRIAAANDATAAKKYQEFFVAAKGRNQSLSQTSGPVTRLDNPHSTGYHLTGTWILGRTFPISLPGVDSDCPFIRPEHEPTKSQATSIYQGEPI